MGLAVLAAMRKKKTPVPMNTIPTNTAKIRYDLEDRSSEGDKVSTMAPLSP
jgi:hypothetical protein